MDNDLISTIVNARHSLIHFPGSDITSKNTSTLGVLQTDPQNESIPEGCSEIRFNDMEYLPWNNPANIVSRDVVKLVVRVRINVLQILFLIGGPANVINMAVFYKQSLRDRVNLLLFSLAVADELYLLYNMVSFFQEFYFQFLGVQMVSPVWVFLLNHHVTGLQGFVFVSFVLSAMIACERCYCVFRPLQYRTLIRTRTLALIIVVVYFIILGLRFLVVSRYYISCFYDPGIRTMAMLYRHSLFYSSNKDLIDYVDNIVFGAGFQSGMLIVVVVATVMTVSRLRQVVAWRTETASSMSAREVGLTKMLIGTSVLLIVCVSPSGLLRIACLFVPDMSVGGQNENFYVACVRIAQMFGHVNSSFNIFIYYVMGSRYRDTFWSLFKKKAKQKKHDKQNNYEGNVC